MKYIGSSFSGCRIIVVIIVIVIVIVMTSVYFRITKRKCKKEKPMEIKALVRQIARWSVASQQDTSPMIALLHANYAAGYLQALELIATEDEINEIQNVQELRKKVYTIQDKAARMVAVSCPEYVGGDVDRQLALLGISGGSAGMN